MSKQIGSQFRETLKESGYVLVDRPSAGVVVLRNLGGQDEVWYANDHNEGYTIQVGRWGYEFGHEISGWNFTAR